MTANVLPEDVDRAMQGFGMAMGPFAVADLSGLDIAWRMRKAQAATRDPRERYVDILDRLRESELTLVCHRIIRSEVLKKFLITLDQT